MDFVPVDSSCIVEGNHIMVRKRQHVTLHIELTPQRSNVKMIAPFVLRFACGPVFLAICRARVRKSMPDVGLGGSGTEAIHTSQEDGEGEGKT